MLSTVNMEQLRNNVIEVIVDHIEEYDREVSLHLCYKHL